MATEDEMTLDERRKYLKRMKPRYDTAKRNERSDLLTEMEQVTGMHRKSLTRLLHEANLERQKRSTPRPVSYGQDIERIIVQVWESLDYVCAERLTPALCSTALHLQRFGELDLTTELITQLSTISRATVERLISKHRSQRFRLPQHGPHRANQVTKGVPMGRIPWDMKEPGHFEVDLVHHCGSSSTGEYLHTLQMVDVATGWSERVAVLGRGQQAMETGFRLILKRVPFPVRQLHPDNGSEFFNQHLVRFWGEEITGLTLSRSRPYHKNDNRFVEQKNDSLVRQYFGTLRLEGAVSLVQMNALYEHMWCYYNLFQPVLHLCEKTFADDKIHRKWDQAQTPYQRLIATGELSQEHHDRLQHLYQKTNPFRLRKKIYQSIATFWQTSQLANDPQQEQKGALTSENLALSLTTTMP